MNMFDRVKDLASKRGKNLKQVAIELGFGENYFYTLKKQSPKGDTLKEIADYFHVSADYLLGRTDNPYAGQTPEQRQLTIEEALKSAMSKDGEPIAEEDIPVLKRIIDAYLDGN
ncbi:helix-turn-helix transcriptional regulator [Enterococcus asini]|uniref:helix-turn-helix domain-containing protein n=1 Tax=Enterococcus asini TaxID=57732 RepID=UPI00288FEFA3|nr:helix-turn-helix transcriptional regulator [Enterococcus asini]MDT2757311.1 helix-turn-helix transcriptional regulator [Enterococcus asini]